jgi:dye decolorizing peroxidase
MSDTSSTPPTLRVSRRGVLAAGGAALLGAAGGFALGRSTSDAPGTPAISTRPSTTPPGPSPTSSPAGGADLAGPVVHPFHGAHQSGVETPPTTLQTFIGLDLRDPTRDSALAVLRIVTDDAARLTQGEPALGDTEPELARVTSGLTVTLGLGRPFFTRTGMGDRIPRQLPQIPAFSTDALEDQWGQTDVLLQVGCDDPLTLSHTIRMLTKDLSTLTEVRWIQGGFRSPEPAVPGSDVTRNVLSQPDGIVNPLPGTDLFDEVVWIPDGPQWMAGGTIMVLRRIRLLVDTWEALDRETQELAIGRRTADGAPLGGPDTGTAVDFDAVDDRGLPVIPADAHIRVAHAPTPAEMILRRPYNYDNGIVDGSADMGLLFAAYMRDPATSFIPMQERISRSDAFNTWNTTIGSAAYVIPSGVGVDGVLAEGIFT